METTARRPGIPATTNVLALLCAMYFINYIVPRERQHRRRGVPAPSCT